MVIDSGLLSSLAGIVEPLDEVDEADVESPTNELEFEKIQAALARFVLADARGEGGAVAYRGRLHSDSRKAIKLCCTLSQDG